MTLTSRLQVLSSKEQDFITPPEVYDWLNAHFHYTLDAAAADDSAKCPAYYTIETNALLHTWIMADGTPHRVFINPPYGYDTNRKSAQAPFFHLAHEQARAYGVVSTLLVPPRTDRWWWHAYVPHARELWLIRDRISFIDPITRKPKTDNTTPSVLVVFDGAGRPDGPLVRFVEVGQRVWSTGAR